MLKDKVQVAGKKVCSYRGECCPFNKYVKGDWYCVRFGGKINTGDRVNACKIKHGDKVFVKIDDTE